MELDQLAEMVQLLKEAEKYIKDTSYASYTRDSLLKKIRRAIAEFEYGSD